MQIWLGDGDWISIGQLHEFAKRTGRGRERTYARQHQIITKRNSIENNAYSCCCAVLFGKFFRDFAQVTIPRNNYAFRTTLRHSNDRIGYPTNFGIRIPQPPLPTNVRGTLLTRLNGNGPSQKSPQNQQNTKSNQKKNNRNIVLLHLEFYSQLCVIADTDCCVCVVCVCVFCLYMYCALTTVCVGLRNDNSFPKSTCIFCVCVL